MHSILAWVDSEPWTVRRARRHVLRRLSPAAVLCIIFCFGSLMLLGFWKPSSTSSSPLVLSQGRGQVSAIVTRRLHTAAPHRQLLARPPAQLHSFLVLDPAEDGSGALTALEPHLAPYRRYPEAVAITLFTGAAAAALAGQFLVQEADLPAVVYLPPMWQNGPTLKQAPSLSLSKLAVGIADFSTWAKSVSRMDLLLMNDWDGNDICFYFRAGEDEDTEVEVGCGAVRREIWESVSLLDTFTARNKTGRALLAQHVALFSGAFVVHPPGFCNYLVDGSCAMTKLPHPTDAAVLQHREANEQRRAVTLREQPHQFKHFTPLGFEKRRAPMELFQALSGYLNASWENVARECWPVDDIYLNHDDAPTILLPLPGSSLTTRIINLVRVELEKWIGGIPLESTAIYGIRIYTTNSSLEMHCDRPDTHIVSAILNVAQDVEVPWPLQIKSHAGNLHSVNMEPGDMTMYEGATCAHGREIPLKGRYFANVFVHFRPRQQQVAVS